MCLWAKIYETREYKKANKGKEFVDVYKILYISRKFDTNRVQLRGPYYNSYKYRIGWNFSDSRRKKMIRECQYISKGIHVYVDKEAAERKLNDWPAYNFAVVKMKAKLSDLLGIGYFSAAVFSKVYLPRGERKKVLASLN